MSMNLAPTIVVSIEINIYDEHHGLFRKLSTTSLWIFALWKSSMASIFLVGLFSRLEKEAVVYESSSAVFATAG